jgi:hypothetical protein
MVPSSDIDDDDNGNDILLLVCVVFDGFLLD